MLSFLSLFRLPANTASLFSPTVATANTTGQQCGPVRIARVRPLIPRVSFFRPRSVLLLPSHTLPSPPLFSLSTRLASLLFSSPPHLFPVLRGAHPSDKISANRPSGRAWNWISGRTFCELLPICLARFRVSRLPNTTRELRELEKGSRKNEIRLRSYAAWKKIPRG